MNVLLLAGGDSNERAVSLKSGSAIHDALVRLGHKVRILDPANGRDLQYHDGELLPSVGGAQPQVQIPAVIEAIQRAAGQNTDVVFMALHGGARENGSIQNLLQLAGARFTGSGMTASAVAMNKALTKRLMASVGVRTPEWALCQPRDEADLPEVAGRILAHFSLPVIVKPNESGSTVGLTKVTRPDHLARALVIAAEHSRDVLVEKFIAGRELTVSVFNGRAYPVVEIRPANELYDYEAKYTKGKSQYLAPAPIDDVLKEMVQEAAVEVYEAVGAEGLARIDFLLDEQHNFHCLELNTLPGMTALSLSPMAFKCEGLDFDILVAMILDEAIKRAR
jgi:D-alanine-D-alanine ligase